jgi:hypothetical protein
LIPSATRSRVDNYASPATKRSPRGSEGCSRYPSRLSRCRVGMVVGVAVLGARWVVNLSLVLGRMLDVGRRGTSLARDGSSIRIPFTASAFGCGVRLRLPTVAMPAMTHERIRARAHHPSSIGCTLDTHGAAGKFESPQDDRRRILGVDGVHDLGGLDGFGPSNTRTRSHSSSTIGSAAFSG